MSFFNSTCQKDHVTYYLLYREAEDKKSLIKKSSFHILLTQNVSFAVALINLKRTIKTNILLSSVPVIVESMCRAYSCAIQIHSPSPCDVTFRANGQVTYYLLYREGILSQFQL